MHPDAFLQQAAGFLSEKSGLPADAFKPGAHLVRQGLVDSLLFMQLIEYVEGLTGKRLESESFSLEKFSTLESIHRNFFAIGLPAEGKA